MSDTTPPAATPAPSAPPSTLAYGERGISIRSYEELFRFAKSVVLSGLAPKGMDKPETVLVALQLGAELGLPPMTSLQSIGVINGRPSIYGDAALALVRSSGMLEKYSQSVDGTGENRVAVVTVKRRGEEPIESRFGVVDAKLAGLWGKPGPWSQYPDRMLMFRARGFALRDAFGDVLRGLATTEEVADTPATIDVTPRPRGRPRSVNKDNIIDPIDEPATCETTETP